MIISWVFHLTLKKTNYKQMKKITQILLFTMIAASLFGAVKQDKKYLQWAIAVANSEMIHRPKLWQADFVARPKWDYTQGLVAMSFLKLYAETNNSAYFDYVHTFADFFVNENGEIMTYKLSEYNIDRLNGGKFLFDMYHYTKYDKYLKAIKNLRAQLDTQPRTDIGVFWHKKIYPYQVWLDGLYMGAPFYAQCAVEFDEPQASFDDIAKQFVLADEVTLDAKTGLNFHAWDEQKMEKWANKTTGHSPHFWGRAMGWYMMAVVDVLDCLPKNHPQRSQILDNFTRLTKSLIKWQDEKTGLWYQIINLPDREGNYLETSCTAMFSYAIAKAVNKGYLPKKYRAVAEKAFNGIVNTMQHNAGGTVSITNACSVAGLGGNPYRSGTFEYYVSEPKRNDDPKVVGPFILAGIELSR